jgi:hypothetical protein
MAGEEPIMPGKPSSCEAAAGGIFVASENRNARIVRVECPVSSNRTSIASVFSLLRCYFRVNSGLWISLC